ncbi:MAG: leucine-rich repeat protein [Ruminococcus sp.]|nr:leucine-rich repeat protein [Ruminococcus sp.]
MDRIECTLRKWLSGLFSVLLLILLFPGKVFALETAEEFLYNENIYYQINALDEVVITRSRASVKEAVIPAEIDGRPVTEIQNNAFQSRTRLTTVSLPDTIQRIGDYAFYQCTRLETVEIPDTVTQIGWGILAGTPWLENQPEGCVIMGNQILIGYRGSDSQVVIPEGTTAIAGRAFEDCESLMSVSIPSTVTEIGGLAFSGCSKLTECTIPEGVVSLGEYAFNWCIALQTAEIADSVAAIGNHAFVGCSSLISVKLPSKLTRIESAVFLGCSNLTKVQIPDTVTDIGSDAFYGCLSLREVTLRSTVRSIGARAFGECTSLEKLTIFNDSCQISDSAETIAASSAIYGLRGSTAQTYAQTYERQFMIAEPVPGDVNENGLIEIADASRILLLYAQVGANLISAPGAYELLAGDMNGDGILDISDATQVLLIYARKGAGLE